jgi:thiamine transporter ThiT
MIVALILAWSLLVVSRVILLYSMERFGVDQGLRQDTLTLGNLLWAAAPTLSVFACACVEKWRASTAGSWLGWLVAAFVGVLIAYVAGFIGLVLSVTVAPPYRVSAQDRFHIPFFSLSRRIVTWAGNFRLVRLADPDRPARWVLAHLPEDLRSGYFDREGHLYPGHWLVLMMLVVSSIVYWGLGAHKGANLGMPSHVPALAYILIGMLVANWILSMAAFFLDRYRIPLVTPILLFCVLSGQSPQSDYYFAVRDGVLNPAVSPADALKAHRSNHPSASKNPNGQVVVVATAGGGIQAAGWTARVLTGLQEQCSEISGGKANFANSVAAISAVSGGAVGALFFVNAYDTGATSPGFYKTGTDLQEIVEQAETPALRDVAWAMVYRDPLRAIFPYLRYSDEDKTLDRGFALEQTWRKRGSIYAYLSNWREGVKEGWRPAVIFNGTVAETGQPFLLATTDFNTGSAIPTRQTFAQAYPNCDVPVVTAARLAASFPYVSPAARPLSHWPEYHIVDGGYYDNFGVDNLVAWLDQALSTLEPGKRPDVLFIQIRSFPKDAFPGPVSKGWFYQTYAPVTALLGVRTTAQLVRDREELQFLRAKWEGSDDHLHIGDAQFEFQGEDAPLSWQLTDKQKEKIKAEWDKIVGGKGGRENTEALETVRSFCTLQSTGTPLAAASPH